VDIAFNKPQDVISLVNAIYDSYQNSDLLKKSIWYWANFESHDFFNWGGDVNWNNYQIPPLLPRSILSGPIPILVSAGPMPPLT